MPRYHFHVMHGGPVILDPEGMDLPDLTAARDGAPRSVRGPVGSALTIIGGFPREANRVGPRKVARSCTVIEVRIFASGGTLLNL